MNKLLRNSSVLASGAIVTAILAPVFAKGLTTAPAPGFAPDDACVGNARHLAQAVLTYAQDYDGKLPPTDTQAHFQAVVTPYLTSPSVFTCPATHLAYVPNPAIGGHDVFEYRTTSGATVLFQDVAAHRDHLSTLAFVDGHIERGGVESGNPTSINRSHLRQIALAALQYVQDNDEHFPLMDTAAHAKAALSYYTTGEYVFQSPISGQPYEFNTNLSYAFFGSILDPTNTFLAQDAIAPPGGIRAIGYADGHVTPNTAKPTSGADANRLKQIGFGILRYSQDNNDLLPPMQTEQGFEAALRPYLDIFVNPLTNQPYILNASLSRQSLASLPDPSNTWLVKDPTINTDGTLFVLFADGHAKARLYHLAQHISVGPNNETRLFWSQAEGDIALSRLSATGVEFSRATLSQGAGVIKSIATSPTGYTRILISGPYTTSLLTLNPSFYLTQKTDYGPYDGWGPVSVSVGGNNQPRLLWNRYDKSSAIWQASAANDYLSDKRYALASGDIATGLAVAPDNSQRLVWTRPSGEVRFWTLAAAGDILSQSGVPPYHDWKAKSVTVGPNGNTWVLFAGTGGSSLMTMSPTQQRLNKIDFPAEAGWTPQEVGVGADGYARVLATNVDGRGRLRIYNNAGALLSSHEFAPY